MQSAWVFHAENFSVLSPVIKRLKMIDLFKPFRAILYTHSFLMKGIMDVCKDYNLPSGFHAFPDAEVDQDPDE